MKILIVGAGPVGLSLAGLVLCGLWLTGCGKSERSGSSRPPAATKASDPAPTAAAADEAPVAPVAPVAPDDGLTLVDGPGLLDTIRKGEGKAVLVNVWASWCGNCKKEIPMLLSVADAVADNGIGLMLVSADQPGDRAKAAAFIDEYAGGRDAYLVEGRMGPFKRTLHPSWKGAIPSTFLFDNTGTLRRTWFGPVYDYEVQPDLQQFLAGTLTADPFDGLNR